MEAKINLGKYEAEVLLEALYQYERVEGLPYEIDRDTSDSLYNKILDAFKEQGVDLERDGEEDDK